MERSRFPRGMDTEGKRILEAEVRSNHRSVEPHRHGRALAANGSGPESGGHGHGLPVKRLYSRRHALLSLILWGVVVAVFIPLAIQFTSRIQSTLSGMKGTPSENVRINVVKNFSTALAFPTAIVWDAKGVQTADDDAA